MAALAATALSAAGAVKGLRDKGKGATSVSQSEKGFASYDPEIKDFALEELFPRIKNYSNAGLQGQPMRAIDDRELHPIFGSRARTQYANMRAQQMYDDGQQQEAAPVEAAPIDQDTIDMLRMEMRGRTLASNPPVGSRNASYETSSMSNEDFQLLGLMEEYGRTSQWGNGGGKSSAYNLDDQDAYNKIAKTFERDKISANMRRFLGE